MFTREIRENKNLTKISTFTVLNRNWQAKSDHVYYIQHSFSMETQNRSSAEVNSWLVQVLRRAFYGHSILILHEITNILYTSFNMVKSEEVRNASEMTSSLIFKLLLSFSCVHTQCMGYGTRLSVLWYTCTDHEMPIIHVHSTLNSLIDQHYVQSKKLQVNIHHDHHMYYDHGDNANGLQW